MTETSSFVTHFSTEALPGQHRTAIWREVFGRQIVKAEFEPIPDRPYLHSATFRSLPGLSFATSVCEGFTATRTGRMIAEGNDDLILTINTEGEAEATQLRRETRIGPYDGVLLSAGEFGAMRYGGRASSMIFRLPRNSLAPVKGLEKAVARPLQHTQVCRLLAAYASAIDEQALSSPVLRQTVATHLADLVLLAIDSRSEQAEVARGRGWVAARLSAIKSAVDARLSDERLSVADIAHSHRITPRYVQMMFATEGTTFSDYVIERRLANAYRMLVDARWAATSVSTIAFEVGFANLSYFNRRFRRRYGGTPSDIREAARLEHARRSIEPLR